MTEVHEMAKWATEEGPEAEHEFCRMLAIMHDAATAENSQLRDDAAAIVQRFSMESGPLTTDHIRDLNNKLARLLRAEYKRTMRAAGLKP